MKVVTLRLSPMHKDSFKNRFGESYQLYSNRNPEIMSPVHIDQNSLTENINFQNH